MFRVASMFACLVMFAAACSSDGDDDDGYTTTTGGADACTCTCPCPCELPNQECADEPPEVEASDMTECWDACADVCRFDEGNGTGMDWSC